MTEMSKGVGLHITGECCSKPPTKQLNKELYMIVLDREVRIGAVYIIT